MRIAVLGPGGVGGFVAAALARAGEDVVVIAREQTASAIAAHGIDVRSAVLGDFVARPAAAVTLDEPDTVLVVAVKATGLRDALARVSAAPSLVVPLLNGIDHLATLHDRFGAQRVIAGVIRVEADRPQPGRVVQTSPSARIDLATSQPSLQPALQAFAARVQAAGIPVRIGDSEAQVMWSKLVRLCALALTTSAADRPLGEIRSDPRWRSALEQAVAEAAAVARAGGAAIDPADTARELEEAHAELGSSMQRDIAAGRLPELDAIAGAVMRGAAAHGIACPSVTWLAGRVAARAGIDPPHV